jgi:hypothetical protein
MNNTETNDNAEKSYPNGLDYDLNELRNFREFMRQNLKGSIHPDDRMALVHIYAKYRKMQKDIEQAVHVPENEVKVSSIEPPKFTSNPDVECQCQAQFVLPGEHDISAQTLQGYLIGFDPDSTNALIVIIDSRSEDRKKYYPLICPIQFLPNALLDRKASFIGSLSSSTNQKSIIDYEYGHVKRNEDKCCILLEGPFSNYYCDEALRHSLHNGLVFQTSKTSFRMIKDRYIWFEEQERHTDIGDIYQVNIGKSNRSGSFVIEVLNSRSAISLVLKIARGRKFEMCDTFRSLKRVVEVIKLMQKNSLQPTDCDRCLQFLLSGTDTFKEVGSFFECGGGHNFCSCDATVIKESCHVNLVKDAIRYRKKLCASK